MSDQEPRPGALARGLMAMVRGYQRAISPLLPPSCRFDPTCSHYAVEAIEVHGAWRGTGMAVLRLLKCGPWHRGGVDMVPPKATPKRAIPADGMP